LESLFVVSKLLSKNQFRSKLSIIGKNLVYEHEINSWNYYTFTLWHWKDNFVMNKYLRYALRPCERRGFLCSYDYGTQDLSTLLRIPFLHAITAIHFFFKSLFGLVNQSKFFKKTAHGDKWNWKWQFGSKHLQ